MRILILVLACTAALADEAPPAAVAAFQAGKAAYERGDYLTALDRFEDAERIAPSPNLLYNIGISLEALGRHGEAAEVLTRYQSELAPPASDAERQFQNQLSRASPRTGAR